VKAVLGCLPYSSNRVKDFRNSGILEAEMRLHSTIAHLTVLMALCLFEAPLCYGTQSQIETNKLSEVIIATQYNNATQTSYSFLASIPISISETPEFNHFYITAAAEYLGRKPTPPEIVKIGFGSRPCHRSDTSEMEVTIWADGTRIYLGNLHLLVCDGGFKRESEFGTIEVSFNDFTRIAEATKVEVQIAEHRFELSDDARRGFQRFLQFMNGNR
jgi:hypothetical protein